jgi:hypothetical protein
VSGGGGANENGGGEAGLAQAQKGISAYLQRCGFFSPNSACIVGKRNLKIPPLGLPY